MSNVQYSYRVDKFTKRHTIRHTYIKIFCNCMIIMVLNSRVRIPSLPLQDLWTLCLWVFFIGKGFIFSGFKLFLFFLLYMGNIVWKSKKGIQKGTPWEFIVRLFVILGILFHQFTFLKIKYFYLFYWIIFTIFSNNFDISICYYWW